MALTIIGFSIRSLRLSVRTPCFQHGKVGSIPAGITSLKLFVYDLLHPRGVHTKKGMGIPRIPIKLPNGRFKFKSVAY